MEILLPVFLCLLAGSEVTSEPTVIRVKEGSDATLNCSLGTGDITNTKFEWKKGGRQVFLYDAGIHSNNGLEGQDQQFTRRVDYFKDKLTSGDASIIIRNTKVDDTGLYTCNMTNHPLINLVVVDAAKDAAKDEDPDEVIEGAANETKLITVDEGSDATLLCSRKQVEDITSKKFVWKKKGLQNYVFSYDPPLHSKNGQEGQDQQFIGRVDYFKDKLTSGNASITIRNTKVADKGLYICGFPDHSGNTYLIVLVVDAAKGLPGWVIALIVICVLLLAGAVVFFVLKKMGRIQICHWTVVLTCRKNRAEGDPINETERGGRAGDEAEGFVSSNGDRPTSEDSRV